MSKRKNLSIDAKRMYLFAIQSAVSDVGNDVLGYKGIVEDTGYVHGHEESSLDQFAYQRMLGAIEKHFAKIPKEFRFAGKYLFELRALQDIDDGNGEKWVLRIDEIDGTTNTKRSIASNLSYPPLAAVSAAFCENEGLDSIIIGSVFDLHDKHIFSGMKTDSGYLSFCNNCILNPDDFIEKKGDTSTRIMVVGYSNRERIGKAEIEKGILDADKTKKDYRIYDGSRSSTQDIISILRNQYDAYVDPRALWPDSGATLFPYDIAGIAPTAIGCGLDVTDIYGEPIGRYKAKNDPLTLIVARKGLGKKIVDAIAPVVEKWADGKKSAD